MKLRLPKFETVSDNDKSVDWKYVKQIYKDYFTGNDLTLKERINMILLNKSHMVTMYALLSIVYGLWLYDLQSTLWIETIIPNARITLGSLALMCMLIITTDCLDEFLKIKKRAKAVLNQDNYCDSEDRL